MPEKQEKSTKSKVKEDIVEQSSKVSKKAPIGMKYVKMTEDEVIGLQIKDSRTVKPGGKLVGYNPETEMALIKE